jgi:nucleoside-diphosphate-sugar epimerase
MRIAVTGASGALGRAVTAAAGALGHEIVGIDRAGGENIVAVDLTSFESLRDAAAGCDGLIHLAAIARPGRLPDHEVHNNNVVASYNALAVAVSCGIRRVCLASSVNALGGAFSATPRYDYFPVDEQHASYCEDPYSLSKWIAEQQAGAMARQHPGLTIASLRMHALVADREAMRQLIGLSGQAKKAADQVSRAGAKDLWGYTQLGPAAEACVRALEAGFTGSEVFTLVNSETSSDIPSAELAAEHYPHVAVRRGFRGHEAFFDVTKARDVLGWDR